MFLTREMFNDGDNGDYRRPRNPQRSVVPLQLPSVERMPLTPLPSIQYSDASNKRQMIGYKRIAELEQQLAIEKEQYERQQQQQYQHQRHEVNIVNPTYVNGIPAAEHKRRGEEYSASRVREWESMQLRKNIEFCVWVSTPIMTALVVFVLSYYYAIAKMGDSCMNSASPTVSAPLTTMLLVLTSLNILGCVGFSSFEIKGCGACVTVFMAFGLIAASLSMAVSFLADGKDCASNGLGAMSIIQFIIGTALSVTYGYVCVQVE